MKVHGGEIVALVGLIGAGRSELAQAIVGMRKSHGGTVEMGGKTVSRRSPRRMLRRGLAMIPESRKEQGLLLERSVSENTVLSVLPALSRLSFIRRSLEKRRAEGALALVDVRAASSKMAVGALSGGNQQKLMFARTLLCEPQVIVADEPTRGVDVGARRAIYELLVRLAGEGRGVLVISSDVEEVLGLAHRIVVMRTGRVVAELDGTTATEHEVLAAAFLDREGAA